MVLRGSEMGSVPTGRLNDLAWLLATTLPKRPSRLTAQYNDEMFRRIEEKSSLVAERVEASTSGRVIADESNLSLGEGKHYDHLAVLFLDICKFSERPNWTIAEQKKVLTTLNIFMSEMLAITREFGGVFEKNTGDGLMAYFGAGARSNAEALRPAIEAAVAMHHANSVISYFLGKYECDPVIFRVGVDVGPVTLGRVAIHGGSHGSITAVGTTANVACKLMRLIPDGGICIGDYAYKVLPNNWSQSCSLCPELTGFSYISSGAPYPGWVLNYRAPWVGFSQ